VEDFLFALSAETAMDSDVGGIGIEGQSTCPTEQFGDSFRALVRQSAVATGHLAEHIDGLAFKSDNGDKDESGLLADSVADTFCRLVGSQARQLHRTDFRQHHATVWQEAITAIPLRLIAETYLDDVPGTELIIRGQVMLWSRQILCGVQFPLHALYISQTTTRTPNRQHSRQPVLDGARPADFAGATGHIENIGQTTGVP